MESYDVFLTNNFVALPSFQQQFGVPLPGSTTNEFVIVPRWQSALQVSGQLGALIGVFVAGPLTSRIGYRYATLTGLMLLNAFIFIFYFAKSMPVFFASQVLEGIPWGIFIANAPAYCSEIVPIKLRAPATQMLQMFWAIGSIIVGAVCYVYQSKEGSQAYRYVLIRITSKYFADEKNQDAHGASMDVPHPARYPHLFCTRVTLVAGSKGTSRRSSTCGRAPWTQVEAKC
jgi:SP family general alpha glucoside:H+ symporter-like MFS transporter